MEVVLYHPATRAFLAYLRHNPQVRRQIRADPDRTLIYAGSFFKSMWDEIADLKLRDERAAEKQTLADVLASVSPDGPPFADLLSYMKEVEREVPAKPDGFIVWRAVSGIFASNAAGKVSFQIGSEVTLESKVFAATEIKVLLRNPHVDEVSKDFLAYCDRCIASGESSVNVGYMSA